MLYRKSNTLRALCLLAACALAAAAAPPPAAHAQKNKKQPAAQPTTGGIKGRVRVGGNNTPADVGVTIRQGDREVAHLSTDAKGEFEVGNLEPGVYGLTLRKPGLQTGRMEDLKVSAGKVVNLKDRLYLAVDEGSIAFLKGSVFDRDGRSLRGVRIEVVLVRPDGTEKKVNSAVTNTLGAFSFRLPPAVARYRVTAKADGMAATTKDVEIEGASIHRVAIELGPPAK